ncbi:MAG: type II toxin-antitoxin system death-on-curing family toxin [Methylocella sp.]
MSRKWRWVSEAVVLAIHDEQLAEHGGRQGIRDIGLLRAALARPKHKAAYGKPDIARLAAAYAFGILRDHPFVDGNKRAALVTFELFLLNNGYELAADEAGMLAIILGLAEGKITETAFAKWVRTHLKRRHLGR